MGFQPTRQQVFIPIQIGFLVDFIYLIYD